MGKSLRTPHITRGSEPHWLTAAYVAIAGLGILALVVLAALSAVPPAAQTAAVAAVAVATATTAAIRAATRRFSCSLSARGTESTAVGGGADSAAPGEMVAQGVGAAQTALSGDVADRQVGVLQEGFGQQQSLVE